MTGPLVYARLGTAGVLLMGRGSALQARGRG